MQTVETVNEYIADRQRTRNLSAERKASDCRDRLIWGDKRYARLAVVNVLEG